MNIFNILADRAEKDCHQNSFEHFAANVFYALRLVGFEVEEIQGKIIIKHENTCVSKDLNLQDTLTSLIRDGVKQRLVEERILIEESDGK